MKRIMTMNEFRAASAGHKTLLQSPLPDGKPVIATMWVTNDFDKVKDELSRLLGEIGEVSCTSIEGLEKEDSMVKLGFSVENEFSAKGELESSLEKIEKQLNSKFKKLSLTIQRN